MFIWLFGFVEFIVEQTEHVTCHSGESLYWGCLTLDKESLISKSVHTFYIRTLSNILLQSCWLRMVVLNCWKYNKRVVLTAVCDNLISGLKSIISSISLLFHHKMFWELSVMSKEYKELNGISFTMLVSDQKR